jgi:hypothetical protein
LRAARLSASSRDFVHAQFGGIRGLDCEHVSDADSDYPEFGAVPFACVSFGGRLRADLPTANWGEIIFLSVSAYLTYFCNACRQINLCDRDFLGILPDLVLLTVGAAVTCSIAAWRLQSTV